MDAAGEVDDLQICRSLEKKLEDPYFILVVGWLAGFDLGKLSQDRLTRYRMLLRRRRDCSVVIHGLWIKDATDSIDQRIDNVDRNLFNYFAAQLFSILQQNQDLYVFLQECWFDIFSWEVGFEDAHVTVENWGSIRPHFKIVVEEYVKHASRSEMPLITYLRLARRMFKEVDLENKLKMGDGIHFGGNRGSYSIDTHGGGYIHFVTADVLSIALGRTEVDFNQPKVCFRCYERLSKPQDNLSGPKYKYLNKIGKICCFKEVKAFYNMHLRKLESDRQWHCNYHFEINSDHLVVIPNTRDRLNLYEEAKGEDDEE